MGLNQYLICLFLCLACTPGEEKLASQDESQNYAKTWQLFSYTLLNGKTELMDIKQCMVFNKDGTFSYLFGDREIGTGKWSIRKEGNKQFIVLSHEASEMAIEGRLSEIQVKKVTKSELLTLQDRGRLVETWKAIK